MRILAFVLLLSLWTTAQIRGPVVHHTKETISLAVNLPEGEKVSIRFVGDKSRIAMHDCRVVNHKVQVSVPDIPPGDYLLRVMDVRDPLVVSIKVQ